MGETISKQIVDSVRRSRKTLIVLSEHYVQSNWTKLEFQAARNLTKKDNIEVQFSNINDQFINALTAESGRDQNWEIIGQSESEPG